MGKIKKAEDNVHILTEREYNYLKLLNTAMTFHTLKDRIISGYLYYVCTTKFGYSEDINLLFEIDLDDDKRELKIQEIKNEDIQNAIGTDQVAG